MAKRSILIVDDEAAARALLNRIFEPYYVVHCARSAREAIGRARLERPDVIISDLVMPEMDGFALFTALRQDPQTCDIPFLMLTARFEAESEAQGRELGIAGYIKKPFDIGYLLERVAQSLPR